MCEVRGGVLDEVRVMCMARKRNMLTEREVLSYEGAMAWVV